METQTPETEISNEHNHAVVDRTMVSLANMQNIFIAAPFDLYSTFFPL